MTPFPLQDPRKTSHPPSTDRRVPPQHSTPPVPAASVDRTSVDRSAKSEKGPSAPGASLSFADLGLDATLVGRLEESGYLAPTPIQAQAIPSLLEGRDVVGLAQTGTGKTAAFSLPMIQNLDVKNRSVQGLVLCPTRELALQVSASLSSYGGSSGVRVLTVYGGAPIYKQLQELRSGVHVVVGTPGRVKDCISRRALDLATVRHVVLDEADEMLRMGFIDDVEEILSGVPEARQTALFSATMPPAIERVARSYLRDPVQIQIEARTRTVERIDQRVLLTHGTEKLNVLTRLIEAEPTDAVLVFARTRASCAHLVESLRARGVAGAALHGDLSQDQREVIVRQLRARKIQLVVATDIAARGLDVEGITHVINYDPPSEPEIYVHRIGRTGRAGREGISILLITPRERRLQRAIESYTGQRMKPMEIPTNRDLLESRIAQFREQVKETIAAGELDSYARAVDELSAEPGADLRLIAAALSRLASRERPLEIKEPEPRAPFERDRGAVRNPSSQRQPSAPRRGPPRENTVRIFVSLGRSAGLRPGDLVGAIANEAGVPGRVIGAIDIRDKVSFVDVASEFAGKILSRMGRVTIRGRTAAFVEARPEPPRHGGKPGPRRFERPNGQQGSAHPPSGGSRFDSGKKPGGWKKSEPWKRGDKGR